MMMTRGSGNITQDLTQPTLELGVVLTGTVSAGAYSAGVMDMLFRALRRYSELPGAPHRVCIKTMAGSSGGALTIFLATIWAMGSRWHLVNQLSRNPLYHYWVERIDAKLLLATDDLKRAGSVSLLNSTVLEDLTAEVLQQTPRTALRQPDWLHPECRLSLTSTALSGIPYPLGNDLTCPYYGDVHHIHLNPDLNDAEWQRFRTGALASAAFPIAFSPKWLSQPKAHAETLLPGLQPDSRWLITPPAIQSALHVDGGVINNSPLELARQYLSGSAQACNPRSADQAHRITLLISPFNQTFDETPLALSDQAPLTQLIRLSSRLLQVMLAQSRFKWDELRLACDTDTYSRFMINPKSHQPLYSHMLGAFGGFLSQAFRHHDYMLGQHNAQLFLQQTLVLPESNPVFAQWSEADKQQWQVGQQLYRHSSGEERTERFLPAIPLVGGELNTMMPRPDRPSALASVAIPELMQAIDSRLRALARCLMPRHLTGLQRLTWGLLQPVLLTALQERIEQAIRQALHDMDTVSE